MTSPSERAMHDVYYYHALANDAPSQLPNDLSRCMDKMDLRGPMLISPYDTSIQRGRPLVFEALAKSETVQNWRDHEGASALHRIFGKNGATAHHVNVLCQHMDPNVTEYPSLDKPIHYAAWHGNKNGMLEALLAQPNIDVNAQTIEGTTAAHAVVNAYTKDALSLGHGEFTGTKRAMVTLGLLERAGADFTIQDNNGRTPIDVLRTSDMARAPEVAEFVTRQDKQNILSQLGAAWKPSDCKEGGSTEEQEDRVTRQRKM